LLPHTQHNEKQLLLKVAEGNREAFTCLYSHYLPAVYKYLLPLVGSKEDTEEMLQEIFVRIWQKRELCATIQCFQAYLFKMARNEFLNYLRAIRAKDELTTRMAAITSHSTTDADHKVLYNQFYTIAQVAIDKLPEKRKEIFRLSTEEGLSLDEIAERSGISKSVVKKQLYAASAYVRQYIDQHVTLTAMLLIFFSLAHH
jgi:RNA polymerase sigma-19 factor, ECF subfamily